MEENKKFYSQRAISITTYFGGPLAAGILIRENYKSLGKNKQGINALIIGIVATILLFIGIFSIPENIIDKVPSALIPLIYTGIIYLIVEKIQGNELKSHKKNNGEFYSGWKAAVIGAISMLFLTGGLFAYVYASESDFDSSAYDNGVSEFVENESKSLQVFNYIETENTHYLIKEFSKSLVLWKENYNIVEYLNSIENLPTELTVQNEKLKKYSELRVEQFELIIKALTEDTDKYENQIYDIVRKIDKIIEELG